MVQLSEFEKIHLIVMGKLKVSVTVGMFMRLFEKSYKV